MCDSREWEKILIRFKNSQCGWERVTGQVIESQVKDMRIKVILGLAGHYKGKVMVGTQATLL